MPRKSIPSYRLHKSSGQGVVTIDARDHYLGKHNMPASKENFYRLIATWLSNGKSQPATALPNSETVITVADVMVAYLNHPESY